MIGLRRASLLLSTAVAVVTAVVLGGCAEPTAQVIAEPSVASEVEADVAVVSAQNVPAYTREELLGQFDPAAHPGFSRIPDAWTDKDGIYLRSEVLEACSRMRDAAAAILARTGAKLTLIKDSPGFIAQRMCAMIANLGCEMAMIGIASAADVDTAMTLGLNYPRGPLALADWLGVKDCHEILVQLQAITGDDRYRPSQWLRRRAQLGMSATTLD